jgi:hypothetical protein
MLLDLEALGFFMPGRMLPFVGRGKRDTHSRQLKKNRFFFGLVRLAVFSASL